MQVAGNRARGGSTARFSAIRTLEEPAMKIIEYTPSISGEKCRDTKVSKEMFVRYSTSLLAAISVVAGNVPVSNVHTGQRYAGFEGERGF